LSTHHRLLPIACAMIAAVATTTVRADDAPPPPQDTWFGKGQFGFLEAKGNTNAESINANLDMSRIDGPWKNEIYAAILYGKNNGIVAAERYEAREQTNYNVTSDLFAFGALRYEHDLFDGFQYQASVTSGMGYKFINTKDTTLSAQVGAGYRWIRPETLTYSSTGDNEVIGRTPLPNTNEAIGSAEVDYSQKLTQTTTLTNKLYGEFGSQNTMVQDQIQLAVKMTTKLALTVGYSVIDNTDPPAPLKKVDQLTTINLQYSF
jgi:putative salt-induced outer membrane protein